MLQVIKKKDLFEFRIEKEQEQQKEQGIENTQNDVATMVFESMQDKMKISQLETDLGNAVIEIMNLKMGAM
ncbi:hypothetical protein [Rummeliibacillus pycnus]|uniref:hypothetical protein n=1 Tax=Rummeliibacillus pycnus TaxID=101070 RepID=UPI0037CA9F79